MSIDWKKRLPPKQDPVEFCVFQRVLSDEYKAIAEADRRKLHEALFGSFGIPKDALGVIVAPAGPGKSKKP